MISIHPRPLIVDGVLQASMVDRFHNWLFHDYEGGLCNPETALKIAVFALTILTGVGYLFALAVCASLDWYEGVTRAARESAELTGTFQTDSAQEIYTRITQDPTSFRSDALELGTHTIMQSTAYTFDQKYRLATTVLNIFTLREYTFQREFFIPITVFREEIRTEIDVPFSLLSSSTLLREMLAEDETFEQPSILINSAYSLADYQKYLPMLSVHSPFSFRGLRSWAVTQDFAHFLDCSSDLVEKIQKANPLLNSWKRSTEGYGKIFNSYEISLDTVQEAFSLHHLPEPIIAPILSFCLSHYIRSEFMSCIPMIEILDRLLSIPNFAQKTQSIPLHLDLSGLCRRRVHNDRLHVHGIDLYFGSDDLRHLASYFPRIAGLNISYNDRISHIPQEILLNLKELHVERCPALIDITLPLAHMNNLEVLRLNAQASIVGGTGSCPRLKIFHCFLFGDLDLSFLNDAPLLEDLWIWSTSDTAITAPQNCPNLKRINILGNVTDLSSLNGHQNIERLDVLAIGAVCPACPQNCPRLTTCIVGVH